MRIITRAFWLLLLFLCATTIANSQDQLAEARALLDQGQYKKANLLFEYVFWQSDSAEIKIQARLGKAQAQKARHQYEEAAATLQTINLLSAPKNLRSQIVYEQVLIEYLQEDYSSALSKGLFAQSVFTDTLNNPMYNSFLLLMSLSAYQNDQFETGEAYAWRLIGQTSASSFEQMADQFRRLSTSNLPHFKSEQKAKLLSVFLPGSGQIYAGEILDGISSFGLHVIGLGGAALAALSGYYVTAWLGAALIVQRVYSGGREYAEELVKKRNRLEKEKYLQPIFAFLISLTT